jgi:hypothetical protein
MGHDIFKPAAPTRADILDTVGDQGMDAWRNPVHLLAVRDGWPARPQNNNERVDSKIMGMETTALRRNGSLK